MIGMLIYKQGLPFGMSGAIVDLRDVPGFAIGRHWEADLTVADPTLKVSRLHAQIYYDFQDENFYIKSFIIKFIN